MKLRNLYTGEKPYSFIAFNVNDSGAAQSLIDNLDREGYRYWFNSKLTPSENDGSEIVERINAASVSIIVLSPGISSEPLFLNTVAFLLTKRIPTVVYVTQRTEELDRYLNMLLDSAKGVIVFREWEQRFSTSNSLKQTLAITKGITVADAKRFYNEGLNAVRDPNATVATGTAGLQKIRYAAEFEYPPAMCFIADIELGKARMGQSPYSEAVKYYEAAARLGNTEAIYRLGCLIADGECFEQDYNAAKPYILYAANHGIADAQYRYAEMLYTGHGAHQNISESTDWYKKALENGERRAYLPLAKRYLDGETVGRNETTAAQYFIEAAEDGSTEAMVMLARLYRDGAGVRKDSVKSEAYFRMAAEKEVADAQYEYAKILQEKRNFTEAFRWLSYAEMKKGKDGNPDSRVLFELGQCYLYGKGTDVDRKTAFMYYHKAAIAGNKDARAAVSECYRRGIGVTVNKKAAEYFAREF